MFVCTVRASSVKFFAVIALTLLVLAGIIIGGDYVFATEEVAGRVNFSGVESEEGRKEFIKGFGYKVKDEAVDETAFVMPKDFDRVMLGYNEIQKAQGLDLSKYTKKKVTRYTYEILDYDGYEGTVYANLLVYRGRVIGCDISSAEPDGFVAPLVKQS